MPLSWDFRPKRWSYGMGDQGPCQLAHLTGTLIEVLK